MADGIFISPEEAADIVYKIKKENDTSAKKFDDLRNKLTQLFRTWEGSAANNAESGFIKLEKNLEKPLHEKIDNCTSAFINVIVPGYLSTESSNTKLGDELGSELESLFR